MGLFDGFKKSLSKPNIPIERTLENLILGSSVDKLKTNPDWVELTGSEKAMFDSGLVNERLFTSASGGQAMCGFLFDGLYKIALMVPASDGNEFIEKFSKKYGKPGSPKRNWFGWEDEDTTLEITIRGPQSNIMLTDKQLLIKAYQTQIKNGDGA